MKELFLRAKKASQILRGVSAEEKDSAIVKVSNHLILNAQQILQANQKDIEEQKALGATNAFIDRLTLSLERLEGICADMKKVATLPTPLGVTYDSWTAESGIKISKVSVPFGVIGVIYEARPNVTVDVFTLCLKSGNACLLKGGKDAVNTNECLVKLIREALAYTKVPVDSCILLPSVREATAELIVARGMVDLLVPRGSKSLIEYVVNNAKIPVIETGAGVCHVYVDKTADLEMAFNIVQNAKMSRPSVCNACETVLVHPEIATKFVEMLKQRIPNLVLHGDENAQTAFGVEPLTEMGYAKEYGDYHMSVKVVGGVEQAVEHINGFGTHHSDCVVCTDKEVAQYFLGAVDSACVYHNASTRFSDGGCFGFGAELGISTQKLHARGPMALREMTSYQYRIEGNGEIR